MRILLNWRLAFVVGLAIRVLIPWYAHGFRYMDEHWQVIEPANFLVNGFWSQATEWKEGLRSWIYPGLVSLPMRLAELIGIKEPIWINAFVRSWHGALSSLSVPLVFASIRGLLTQGRHKEDLMFAGLAAWLVALWPYSIYCGFHTHGEMAGALFVLAGATAPYLVKSRGYILSGAFFGCALALKIDVAVAGLAFGIWQLARSGVKEALHLAVGVLPFILAVGWVDKLTWGTWFHSVLGHARVNLVEEIGNQWGVSPWYTHVFYYFDITGVPALLSFFLLPWVWKKIPEPLRAIWFLNAFFVAVFCAVEHKEKRFIAPLVYTGQVAAFATLAYGRDLLKKLSKPVWIMAGTLFFVHLSSNTVTYLVKRTWWNRIEAIYKAGQIEGIEKMLSPQWSAIFYLPRHVPSAATQTDRANLAVHTKGLRSIGVASDWKKLTVFEELGFTCKPWPKPLPQSPDPIPWAWHCSR
ncbi:MAG: hypothetical protein AB1540_13120 [Bdellovibrionota bacterium]